jgi:hypothetical protein
MSEGSSKRARLPIRVGATYRKGVEPEPERFHVGAVTYDVAEIVDRWYQGPRRAGGSVLHYYKVRSRGESVFLIAYDQTHDDWFLVQSFGPEAP